MVESNLIDCNIDPFIPSGLKVEQHQKGGQFQFDPKAIEFYLSDAQHEGQLKGSQLLKELAKKPVLNANVLDWLMANPERIPKEWKRDEKGRTRYIFFWGTIYRNLDGKLSVRYLYWSGSRWHSGDHWLGNAWLGYYPAALRAS